MLEKLFKEGFLRKTSPSFDKMRKSLEISQTNLTKAKAVFKINLYDIAVWTAYSSMFHAARSVLFRDGIKERAHWAVVEYLREKYAAQVGEGIISKFDSFRILRHSTVYGLEGKVERDEARAIIEFAEEFLKTIKKVVA